MGWANVITIGRGLLTIGVWVLTAYAEGASAACWGWVFALFVLTAVTDMLDGAVARRLGQVSVFGRIADPLVDKLLVLGTLTVLVAMPEAREVLPVWVVVLVLARELVVTALRAAVESGGASFQAAFWGKLKMLSQCVAVGGVLLYQGGVGWVRAAPAWLGGVSVAHAAVLLAAVLTALSLVDYLRRARRLLGRA